MTACLGIPYDLGMYKEVGAAHEAHLLDPTLPLANYPCKYVTYASLR